MNIESSSAPKSEMFVKMVDEVIKEIVSSPYWGIVEKIEHLKNISPSYKEFHSDRNNGGSTDYIIKYPNKGKQIYLELKDWESKIF